MVNTCDEALKTGVLFATCSLLVRITFAKRANFANKNRTRSEGETIETRGRSRSSFVGRRLVEKHQVECGRVDYTFTKCILCLSKARFSGRQAAPAPGISCRLCLPVNYLAMERVAASYKE